VYCYTNANVRNLLRELRLKKNLTQQNVADCMKVTKGYISQIENGRTKIPKYRVLVMILSVYGIKPKYFEYLLDNKIY